MTVIHPTLAPTLQVSDTLLAEVVRRFLTAGSPRRIVLFGSHARGDAHANSDLDLLIVEDSSQLPPPQQATPYRMSLVGLRVDMDIDIVVYTPAEIERWANVPLAFTTTILREGKVLYERPG